MSVDRDLIAAGFSAAEMGVDKLRKVHAKIYSDKFAAFASFEANSTFSDNTTTESIERGIRDLWTDCVVGEKRWEVRASFSVMVAKVVLKAASTTNEATSKAAEDLTLWCLRGDGDGESQTAQQGDDMHTTHDTHNTSCRHRKTHDNSAPNTRKYNTQRNTQHPTRRC